MIGSRYGSPTVLFRFFWQAQFFDSSGEICQYVAVFYVSGFMKSITIIKADGSEDVFDPLKLRRSLEKAGATVRCQDAVVKRVTLELHSGTTTKSLYSQAFRALKKCEQSAAARYSLKQAIFGLGPSGYPFEKFIGEIWKTKGYKVDVGQLIRGRFVTHEVDVVARRDGEVNMMECKYHNQWGSKCDVKVALYVDARMKDLAAAGPQMSQRHSGRFKGWLVTNSKLSADAIQYGEGVGLNMMAWAYPRRGNLQELIESTGLYPVTVLLTLGKEDVGNLLTRGIVLCRQVDSKILKSIGLNTAARSRVEEEIERLRKGMA